MALAVFALVYAGMILGRIPGLALDRPAIALVGAIALLATRRMRIAEAAEAVDLSTLALLFALMIVSTQLRLGGFYSRLMRWLATRRVSPSVLLAILVGVVGLLSAVVVNDIVCLAATPVLIAGCVRRGLDPRPFLLALACAANVGSAATLIGNPQNILIGQVLELSFARYLTIALPPALIGLGIVWAVIGWLFRRRWSSSRTLRADPEREFDPRQTAKGLAVLLALVVIFLLGALPRDVVALAGAGLLLCASRYPSRRALAMVDWQLLVLFTGLFMVNHAVHSSDTLAGLLGRLQSAGVEPSRPAWLFGLTVVLSNVVSNVPAVMLLLPSATYRMAGPILALSSTLAGNLLLVGSIANLIVVDRAAAAGVQISWRDHARVGVPITLLTLGTAALWLWLIA